MYSTNPRHAHRTDDAIETTSPDHPASGKGFVERFLDSFLQEKNIKWMLVIGAAIVFGSSLMLVTKAWPQWTPSLKYLAIIGYTTAIFLVSELSRRRLKLQATYRVLQSLTLLLLPVCFLSLTWITSGTAIQDLSSLAWKIFLMIPALALLWQASPRILDHWMRGRQTTFLVSYGLLCIAGAVPEMTSAPIAFALTLVCWGIFTAGVVKINRHTFWLTEQHRLPRVFGFLPIAMLGLQLIVLVGTKAISVLPPQWIGFAIVLVSVTILLTARSVADVLRRRTGDLVRPLPWSVIVPLLGGLALTVLGVGLSMMGFSYTGTTTYAVVPTALFAAAVFAMVARDTNDRYLVWACLIAVTIAYQCSPVLFGDLVQSVRTATADAINRQRVPLSMYGLTYLPLLGLMTLIGGFLQRRNRSVFSKPIQQFVTALAIALQLLAVTDLTSFAFVCLANVLAMLMYAIAFQDQRYALLSMLSAVMAISISIPVGNQLGIWQIDIRWSAPALAGMTLLMTLSPIPDRWIRRIPTSDQRHALKGNWVQLTGCGLAAALGLHWIVSASATFLQPLMPWSLYQFGFLLAATILYTLRNPSFSSAYCVWVLTIYAAIRSAFGFGISPQELAVGAAYASFGGCVIGFLLTHWLGIKTRNQLARRVVAFSLPLQNLSALGILVLALFVYIPGWLIQHVSGVMGDSVAMDGFGLASIVLACGMVGIATQSVRRWIAQVAAIIAPVAVTSLMFSSGFSLSAIQLCLIWGIVQCVASAALCLWLHFRGRSQQIVAMIPAVGASLIGLAHDQLLFIRLVDAIGVRHCRHGLVDDPT